ncbi:MAG: hypothetical protein ACI85I_000513 [Arenicella sp.]
MATYEYISICDYFQKCTNYFVSNPKPDLILKRELLAAEADESYKADFEQNLFGIMKELIVKLHNSPQYKTALQ